MSKYKVLVVGMGKRGMHHATAFNANPKFQVAGICDIDPKRLDDAAAKLGNPQMGADAAALAKAVKPDVFCFCTLPNLRTPMIKAAIGGGAKLIAFEKPVALTSAELFTIRDLLKQGRRQSRRQPPASVWQALPEGEGDHRQRRVGPRPYRLWQCHRLDDAHALAPH